MESACEHIEVDHRTRNGNRVAFASDSPDLVAGDTNTATDVFVWSAFAGTVRVSVSSSGDEPSVASENPHISRDGNVVAFSSYASNLVASKRIWRQTSSFTTSVAG